MCKDDIKILVWGFVMVTFIAVSACSGEGGGSIGTPPGDTASDEGSADIPIADVSSDIVADAVADVAADVADAGGSGGPCGSYVETIQPIFDTKCIFCHGASGGLSLAPEDALGQMVGVDNVAGTMPRVDPGNPDNSYLVLKVEGHPDAGTPMPIGTTGLDAPLAAHIRAWVEAGAPDGEYGTCGEDTGSSDVVDDIVDPIEDPGVVEEDVAITDAGEPSGNCSSFETTIQPIFTNNGCTTTYCHGGSTNPDLRPGMSLASIISAESMYGGGLLLVLPDDPDNSFLLEKVESSSPSHGNQMPLGGSPLSQEDLDALRHWITIGAPNIPYDCVEEDAGSVDDTSLPVDEGTDEGSTEDVVVEPVPSWATDIDPIMQAKCGGCHTANPNCSGGACFLDSYEDTQLASNTCMGEGNDNAPMYLCMWLRVQSGSMPLGGGCGFEPGGASCLTAEELTLLEDWANGGGPE